MRKLLIFSFIAVNLFSCKKSQENAIVGTWREVSVFTINNSGQLAWGPASKFPLSLWFSADGKYSARNDVPAGHGNYQFNYSTKELKPCFHIDPYRFPA
jgi:hypothetical protein